MASRSESRSFISYQKLVEHLKTPLFRNGYFLTLSSLATSGIGLIYWIVAAHKYPAYNVGINTAIISSMTFIAGISEINLMSALIRFIPVTGRFTKRFVLYSYFVSLIFSMVASFVYLKNLGRWSPALEFMGNDNGLAIWFVISTMMWCVFVLQDAVLTGLRRASWVPLENTVFSLTKIALMIPFAVTFSKLGIFASWSFALIVAIIPTNYFIFRKLIPSHANQPGHTESHVTRAQVVRFVAPDYLGAIFWLICTTLMPVIVTTVAGATANAYFYLAWTIANTLYLIGPAMGSSLVVEASNDPQKLSLYSYRMFKNTTKLVVPAAIIIALGAPYILMIFGKGYSSEGATLLRLLALSAIPSTVNAIFVSISRVQRRMTAVLATTGTLYIMVLAFSYILLKLIGITGVGIGWLGSQIIVAIIVYTTQLRRLWADTEEGKMGKRPQIISPNSTRSVLHLLYKITAKLGLFSMLFKIKQKINGKQRKSKLMTMMPLISSDFSAKSTDRAQGDLELDYVVNNQTSTTVAMLRTQARPTPLILKMPGNSKEAESLDRQIENLLSLFQEEQLGSWRKLLPEVITRGNVNGHEYLVESAMPGEPVINLIKNEGIHYRTLDLVASGIAPLHQATARLTMIGMDLLEEWVNGPLNRVSHYISNGPHNNPYQNAIDRLQTELNVSLASRQVCVSWIHGDYSPWNVLVDPGSMQVTGIVDWDLARPIDLPLLDLIHFLISVRMELEQRELGHVVRDLLQSGDWTPEEMQMIRKAESNLPGNPLELRVMLLLAWLHHINANLSKTSRYDRNSLWLSENVLSVLKVL